MCSRPPSSSQPIEPPPAPIVCTSIIGSDDGVAVDLAAVGDLHLAVLDERDVVARAAHVDDEAVLRPGRAGVREPRHRPAGRPGQHRRRGDVGDDLGGRDAAVGLHDEQDAAEVLLGQALDEPLDVAAQHRADVGVHRRRRHALVQAHLREDLRGDRQEDVGRELADHVGDLALVGVVRVGVHEADRDRLGARGRAAPAPRRGRRRGPGRSASCRRRRRARARGAAGSGARAAAARRTCCRRGASGCARRGASRGRRGSPPW